MITRIRRRAAAGLVILALSLGIPLGVALASHNFTDVPDSNIFHADIEALVNSGVTTGCATSPARYCPSDFVTREQMAAFMNRLGALAPGKTPVVNADKVDGLDASALLLAGDIKVQHYGPWFSNGNFSVIVENFSNVVTLGSAASGTQFAQMPLVAPTSITGRTFGLKSVEVCYTDGSTNVTITNTRVAQASISSPSSPINDSTVRDPAAGTACYTVTDPTPTVVNGNQMLILGMSFTAAGDLSLASTTTTWTPTTALALEPETSAGNDPAAR